MKAALCALTALTEGRQPAAYDIANLEGFAGPRSNGESWAEFACKVIQMAIRDREVIRRMAGES